MKCFVCGAEMHVSSNFMRSECGMIDDGIPLDDDGAYPLDDNDDAIVATYMCECCGASYEVGEATPNERKNEFKEFWNKYE